MYNIKYMFLGTTVFFTKAYQSLEPTESLIFDYQLVKAFEYKIIGPIKAFKDHSSF